MSPQKPTPRTGATPRRDRQAGRRRAALVALGVLLVALFVGFAAAQGLGNPDVPSDAIAVVEDAPGETKTVTDCNGDEVESDPGTITKAEFDCALKQTASRAGLQKVPKPGTAQYDDLKQAAIGDLLDTVWIQGEAAEQGVTASQREVDAQLDQIVSQNFRCPNEQDPFDCAEFQRFLDRSSFSEDDVLERVKLQILSTELQSGITEAAQDVSADQIQDYYDAAKEQFTLPASRDIRLILNRDEAKVEEAKSQLEADDSEASWRKVAQEFSSDPVSKRNGGLRQGLTEGLLEEPLNGEVFSAPKGEIVGPVKTPLGSYVFQVETINPERTQPLNEVQDQIRSQLAQTAQQDAFSSFIDDYGSRWQSRTFCASDYLVERCANFETNGHPEGAPPGCYEANPKGGRPDCPAAVLQATPALPGTVDELTPDGTRLAQRPRPAGLPAQRPQGLPGAGGALTP